MNSRNGKTLVIQHGTLIDGSGRPATVNEAIVIEGNRIRNVGRLPADVRIEDQDHVQVIDATEQWIMPGLIDGHCHLSFGFPQVANVPSARGTTNPGFSALRAARNAPCAWKGAPMLIRRGNTLAEIAKENRQDIIKAEKPYSKLKSEEISGDLSYRYENLLDFLKRFKGRKSDASYSDLDNLFDLTRQNYGSRFGWLSRKDTPEILEAMISIGFLGVREGKNVKFAYNSEDVEFSENTIFTIHPAFHSSLSIR